MACYPPTGSKTAGPCFARRRVQGEPAMGTRLRNAITIKVARLAALALAALIVASVGVATAADAAQVFNVKDFGATGDGTTNDTPAINDAVVAANAAGGGIVEFPTGTYLAGGSIHLLSNVTLRLDAGSTLLGAASGYDVPEPNPYDQLTIATSGDRDGWNVINTQNVSITNITDSSNDDALAFKSDYALGQTFPNGNVIVDHAALSAGCCNALMFGSETCGNFTGYNFSNITITSAGKSGLGMVSMDGANISDV